MLVIFNLRYLALYPNSILLILKRAFSESCWPIVEAVLGDGITCERTTFNFAMYNPNLQDSKMIESNLCEVKHVRTNLQLDLVLPLVLVACTI